MSWRSGKLDSFLTLKRGYDLPSRLREDGDVPIVSSSGVTGWHKEAKVEGPGVVTGRYGTLGQVFYIDEDFWPLNTSLYVRDFKGNDPRYVSYLLQTLQLEKWGATAAVPGLNRNVLHRIDVRLPDLEVQKEIVGVLSAYDDLMAINRQRIERLEEAARLLYQEWFVRLQFPGHEQVAVTDGLPEGWTLTTSDRVLDVLGGGTPDTKLDAYWDGEIPFFTPKDANPSVYVLETEKQLTRRGLQNCNSPLYPTDTLFITARGTVGKMNLAHVPMAMNQSCYALRARPPLNQRFLYLAMSETVGHLQNQATGSVFSSIVTKTFSQIPFHLPSAWAIDRFTKSVSPFFDQIRNLSTQNQQLAKARNILLPRLMSGEVTP